VATDSLSRLRWKRRVAVRVCDHVFPEGFPAPSTRRRCVCYLHAVLCMSASGATVGFIKYYLTNSEGQLGNFFVGCLTFYLVATAWWAARRKDGETSIFDWAGLPVAPYFVFGAGVALCRRRRSHAGARRSFRYKTHCATPLAESVAFFIAAASFFLGQQKVMPVNIRGSKLLFVPPLLILIFLIYWLCHMWFTNTLKHKVIPAKPSTALS
jgi:hypothetical protein